VTSSVAEIALAFCRECLGWKKATIGNSPFAGMIGNGPLPGSECFNFVSLNTVMEAARAWWQSVGGEKDFRFRIELGDNLNIVSINRHDDAADIAGIATAPCENLCFGLMAACLEAARKLKEAA
jgi:hypothetical protein